MQTSTKDIFQQYPEDYRSYAISQLDPFHDTSYVVRGAPTDQIGTSVVITQSKDFKISCSDFGITPAEGTFWDFHTAILPLSNRLRSYAGVQTGPNTYVADTVTGTESLFTTLDQFTVSACAAGSTTFTPNAAGSSPTFIGVSTDLHTYTSAGVTFPNQRLQRVIGQSFEVVDETPDFYKQGSATIYRKNSNTTARRNRFFWNTPSGTNAARTNIADSCASPPNRLEDAVLLPGSVTWPAKEGAYVIARSTVEEVPFVKPSGTVAQLVGPPIPSDITAKNCFFSRDSYNASTTSTVDDYYDSSVNLTPYDISGAYFSGLSTLYGVFRIRTKLMIEILPEPYDNSLISISTPTLPPHSLFEDHLREVIRLLPHGIRQTDNPSGEWWKFVKKIVKTAGKVLRGPVGQAIQKATGTEDLVKASTNLVNAAGNLMKGSKQNQKSQVKASAKTAPTKRTSSRMSPS
jgi:hypothetical protein